MDRTSKKWWCHGVIWALTALLLIPMVSQASWNILLHERFELPAVTWPWGMWHLGCYS